MNSIDYAKIQAGFATPIDNDDSSLAYVRVAIVNCTIWLANVNRGRI